MSKFQIGDEVQLNAESVRFYEEDFYNLVDPDKKDTDWNQSGKVTKSWIDEDISVAMYIVSGFPFSFYEFELEYANMRKG